MEKYEIEVVTENHKLNNEEQEINNVTKQIRKMEGKRRLIIIGSILLGGAISVLVPSVIPGMLGIAEVTPEILHGLLIGGIGAGLAGTVGFSLVGMIAYNKPIRILKRKLNKLDPERKKRYEDLANERVNGNPLNKKDISENNEFMSMINQKARSERLANEIKLSEPKEGFDPAVAEKKYIDKDLEEKRKLAEEKIKKLQELKEKLNTNDEQTNDFVQNEESRTR